MHVKEALDFKYGASGLKKRVTVDSLIMLFYYSMYKIDLKQ